MKSTVSALPIPPRLLHLPNTIWAIFELQLGGAIPPVLWIISPWLLPSSPIAVSILNSIFYVYDATILNSITQKSLCFKSTSYIKRFNSLIVSSCNRLHWGVDSIKKVQCQMATAFIFSKSMYHMIDIYLVGMNLSTLDIIRCKDRHLWYHICDRQYCHNTNTTKVVM